MKELIEQIDTRLSRISVSGDSVIYLAEARKLLSDLYKSIKENKEAE